MGLFPFDIWPVGAYLKKRFMQDLSRLAEFLETSCIIRFIRETMLLQPTTCTKSLYTATNYILNNNIAGGFSQTVLSNPNLTWETTYMSNVGVDYGFLKNRLTGSIEWYNKDTKGILISLPVSIGTWNQLPYRTKMQVEVNNRGVDFDIHWRDNIDKVAYSVGFNNGLRFGTRVTKFRGDVSSISGVYKIQEGKPIKPTLRALCGIVSYATQSDMDYVQSLVDKNPSYFATYQRPALGDFLFARHQWRWKVRRGR